MRLRCGGMRPARQPLGQRPPSALRPPGRRDRSPAAVRSPSPAGATGSVRTGVGSASGRALRPTDGLRSLGRQAHRHAGWRARAAELRPAPARPGCQPGVPGSPARCPGGGTPLRGVRVRPAGAAVRGLRRGGAEASSCPVALAELPDRTSSCRGEEGVDPLASPWGCRHPAIDPAVLALRSGAASPRSVALWTIREGTTASRRIRSQRPCSPPNGAGATTERRSGGPRPTHLGADLVDYDCLLTSRLHSAGELDLSSNLSLG